MQELQSLCTPFISALIPAASPRCGECAVLDVASNRRICGTFCIGNVIYVGLWCTVEAPQRHRLANASEPITWAQAQQLFPSLLRRFSVGLRDCALPLAMVTDGYVPGKQLR